MKLPYIIIILLFSKIFWAEAQIPKIDSLDLELKKQFQVKSSAKRDSIITLLMYNKSNLVDNNSGDTIKIEKAGSVLRDFSKMTLWSQTQAYSLMSDGVFFTRKGYNNLAFDRFESVVKITKNTNKKLYLKALGNIAALISYESFNNPEMSEATFKKYLEYSKSLLFQLL